ncbi:hypothetical protein BN938_3001 [Mucinivorans hirudinis]|uniref:Uncharacterized protein n=1 Tax=Mucinivorans hirudinis TaxID=1433126 RepID=A0A060REG4_9BACT|nr:hypothetical protein BN938_3001 [Mucinivorans hirudinis]
MPDKEQFHYFLLDSNYRVRLVGSPVNNPRMWQLYKTRIAELNQ